MGIIDDKLDSLRGKFGDEAIDRINQLRDAAKDLPPIWGTEEVQVSPGLDYKRLAEIVFTAVFLSKQGQEAPVERAVDNGRHMARLLFKDEAE